MPYDPTTVAEIHDVVPKLRRYARSLVKRADVADDLVQECLARALKGIDRWTPGTSMRAWLFTILHRIYLNEARRRPMSSLEDIDLSQSLGASAATQDRRIELTEVAQAFEKLSPDHRQILLLVVVEGMTYEEAASVLGVEVGTVRSRVFRARARLVENMGPVARVQEQGRVGGPAASKAARAAKDTGSAPRHPTRRCAGVDVARQGAPQRVAVEG